MRQRRSSGRIKAGLVSLVALLTCCLAAAPALGFSLSSGDRARLAAGEAVVRVTPDGRGASGHIRAAIEIQALPAAVWRVMLDCERSPRFVRGLESCRIVERDPAGRWDVREHRIAWLAIMPRVRSVFRSRYETHRTISFHRLDGDLTVLEGFWRLEPAGSGTRLFYEARVGIAAPVPDFLVRSAIESDLPRTLEALRQEVMSDARR